MPNLDWGVYKTGETEGTEVSSTYEGRHVTCTAAELTTDGGAGTALKGHACVFGLLGNQAVGVCFNSGTLTDLIAIDTEGIWNLPVLGQNDGGNTVLRPGTPLFININTCAISAIRNNITQVPFGYLLTQAVTTVESIQAVKVHWDPQAHWLLDDEDLHFGDGNGGGLAPLGGGGDVILRYRDAGNVLEMLPEDNDEPTFSIGNGTLSMDVQIFGESANDFMLWDASESTLNIVNTQVEIGDHALDIRATQSAPNSEGLSAYFEGTINGNQANLLYNVSSWINVQTGFVGNQWMTPYEGGFSCSAGCGANMSNTAIGGMYGFYADGKPTNLYVWRVNIQPGIGAIDALIQGGNDNSVGYSGGVTGDGVIGAIPLCETAGTGMMWVEVHATVS